MRVTVSAEQGVYVQRVGAAKPVEVVERTRYVFVNEERTCLVTNPKHVAFFLQTGQYRIVGIEVPEGQTRAAPQPPAPAPAPKQRGRPKGQ